MGCVGGWDGGRGTYEQEVYDYNVFACSAFLPNRIYFFLVGYIATFHVFISCILLAFMYIFSYLIYCYFFMLIVLI